MDIKTLEYFKELLINEKKKHDNVLNKMKKNNMGENDKYASGELSNYDNHPGDLGTEVYELEHNMGLQVHEEHFIKDIDDAIRKIDNDSFGLCEFCGKPLDEERLEIIPYARLCIKCEDEKQLDSGMLELSRPVEEKVIRAPFGRKFWNAPEPGDDEHEGMDQFNDLMKYGSSDSPQDLGGFGDYKEYYTNKEDQQGIVDEVDKISNDDYERQIPD